MAGKKGKSGGKRKGAGAPLLSERLGSRNERGGLHYFNFTRTSSSTSNNRATSTSTHRTHASSTASRAQTPPRQPNVTSPRHATAASVPATAHASSTASRAQTPPRQPNVTSPRHATTASVPATAQRMAQTRTSTTTADTVPNLDSDEAYDDSLLSRGKKMGQSRNLKLQKAAISKTEYRNKWFKKIHEEGIMWDTPPDVIKNPKHKLQERWLDFFKLRVFNWMPDAILGEKLKCYCPNCNKKLAKNGNGNLPRLVFDTNENYWLNAPSKYICSHCESDSKDHPEKKIQYSWVCTSDTIMSQLKAQHPEVYEMFPCHLSAKNAIDKKLMNTVIHNAVKGIGPAAMAENLASWHELEWQKKEAQWGANVQHELENPTVDGMNNPIRRSDIEKCPYYFSEELGGYVPGGAWLVEMFCLVIQRMRPYLDSECIKRAKASLILAVDASYKVPKWMMTWGGNDRIFGTLHSGTNECNEVIWQKFSTSDNHHEMGCNLAALEELGLNPFLCFSDDPTRDESLLKNTFSNLRNENDNNEEEEDVDENLTVMTSPKDILYLTDIDTTLTIFHLLFLMYQTL